MEKIILAIILEVLYRALRVLERRDDAVARELRQLPDGACVRIRTSLAPDAPQLTVVCNGGAVHAIGHALGGVCHIPHGEAMAILLPHVML